MSAYPAPPPSYPDPPLQQDQGGPADINRDPLDHHHTLQIAQPYPFDSPQSSEQRSYLESPNGHSTDPQQLITSGKDGTPKGNRLRKACDSCSIRKVKCDESGPPCRACAALDIPCTFERPSRRRGPPNRHAETIKRQRVEPTAAAPSGFSSPASPGNVAVTLASFSSHAVLSAESICPFSTLELLVDDFFTYIHPLVPFPHEPSFRAAFSAREDLSNPSFLALLASMVGTLVASFPRKPRLHLKAQHREYLFPNSISLVERCHKVAVEARGAGYLDKDLTIYDAATSYFLALAAAYTSSVRQSRLYLSETLTILKCLGVHRVKDPAYYSAGVDPESLAFAGHPEPVDYIKQEIGRRMFWVMFAGLRSMQQLGAAYSEIIIPPSTPSAPYPPLPLEVDDQHIFVSHIEPQPENIVSEITGFNLNIQVYMTCNPVNTMELAYGIDEVFDWNRQRRVLEECLHAVKRVLDIIPRELMLTPAPQTGELDPAHSLHGERTYYPPLQEYPGSRMGIGTAQNGTSTNTSSPMSPEAKRHLQYEIQKANIYASQLGTRSYIVEKYWNMFDAYTRMTAVREAEKSKDGITPQQSSPGAVASGLDTYFRDRGQGGGSSVSSYDMIESQISVERENIVKDLLHVLGSISQVNMEPNGGSFINKIRQIAATLLDGPSMRKGPLALKAEEYLAKFLDVLMKLERSSASGRSAGPEAGDEETGISGEGEEEELRNWADLRECQTRFARSAGFAGDF